MVHRVRTYPQYPTVAFVRYNNALLPADSVCEIHLLVGHQYFWATIYLIINSSFTIRSMNFMRKVCSSLLLLSSCARRYVWPWKTNCSVMSKLIKSWKRDWQRRICITKFVYQVWSNFSTKVMHETILMSGFCFKN